MTRHYPRSHYPRSKKRIRPAVVGLKERGNRASRSAFDTPIIGDDALVCINRKIADHELT